MNREQLDERTWKRRLFRKNRTGVCEWRGWTMPVLRIGRWQVSLTHYTHQIERDWEIEL